MVLASFPFIFKTPVKKPGDGRKVTFFEPGSEETSTSEYPLREAWPSGRVRARCSPSLPQRHDSAQGGAVRLLPCRVRLPLRGFCSLSQLFNKQTQS